MPSVSRLLPVALYALGLTGLAGATEPARPNILWLVAEDFGPQLGCYGTKEVWTPNLDKLAAERRTASSTLPSGRTRPRWRSPPTTPTTP